MTDRAIDKEKERKKEGQRLTVIEREIVRENEREREGYPGVNHISEVVMALEEVQIMSLAVARRP